MTVSSTVRKVVFSGNGTTTVFPFAFKVFSADDLEIVKAIGGSSSSTLVLNSDYTVSLNADQDTNPGGTVTLTTALASGNSLTITTDIANVQGTLITNQGGFYASTMMAALDYITICIQQMQEQLDRCIKLPIVDPGSLASQLPAAPDRAGKLFYFGSDGGVSLVSSSPSGTSLFSGNMLETPDGSRTVFSLTNGGSSLGKTPLQNMVWVNYPLAPGVGYNLGPSPGQVTFTTAPAASDTVFAQGVY